MHPVAEMGKETVEKYVRNREVPSPSNLTPEMEEKAGVFVSIHKQGQLRGCIGTFSPTQSNVAEEIIQNAISSATRDPRFSPITTEELSKLTYKVDILSEPEPIRSKEELDPERYGVIVESKGRKGLLLPNLEGVDTVDQQIGIAMSKAGIMPSEQVNLHRFEVRRFE